MVNQVSPHSRARRCRRGGAALPQELRGVAAGAALRFAGAALRFAGVRIRARGLG